jgi:hypothetical protein
MNYVTVDVPESVAPEIMDYIHRLSRGEKLRVVEALPPGSGRSRCKLTAEDVRTIRLKHSEGISQYALSKRYKLAQSTVSDIINRKMWRDI